ncbi:tagatose-bisphosphate aldolase [Cryptococcus neoformans]|nr:tagatose-bisphosphate aldolase [Cryptococcus neoformans var. grubii c45]OXB34563.1 tagatose-bisphosphate aldolase [Cryptococcus neoformans var. grubii]OXC58701.1 tagatose-bisphosphate aldolase [Cryptococcus neoformans var. grubii MW-RSA852]
MAAGFAIGRRACIAGRLIPKRQQPYPDGNLSSVKNMSLENNLTLNILKKAEDGGYGIVAQTCYDANMAVALVRAAERNKSPAILQLFPVTLAAGGGPLLQYCLDVAHNASVPISVHLDHATDPEHLELSIGLAEKGIKFDSIMVDASHADTDEENIAIAVPYIKRCRAAGVATEVELGRLEGGEAGLREITGAMLTDPANAEEFMKATGADILAPSYGNLHGSYKFIGGPKYKLEILKDLQKRFRGRIPYLCAHGTDELPDSLFQDLVKAGVSKFNINSWARDPYVETLGKELSAGTPFPDASEKAIEAFAQVCDHMMELLGSKGKAA